MTSKNIENPKQTTQVLNNNENNTQQIEINYNMCTNATHPSVRIAESFNE